jgi:DNA-binding SARP family transcriptional activator
MVRLDVGVLGPLSVRAEGVPVAVRATKQRALLTTLALHHDRTVAADTLVTFLWDEPLPERADHALQQHVSAVRKLLHPDGDRAAVLLTCEPGYELRLASLDLDDFTASVARAAEAERSDDLGGALDAVNTALGLVRGGALADVRQTTRLDGAARRVDEQVLDAHERRLDLLLQLGRPGDVLAEVETLIEREPYREWLRAQQMLALYRVHRQTEALAVYRATRQLLIEELGVEPGRALRELEQAILRQDPALDDGRSSAPAPLTRTVRAGAPSERGWIELPDGQAIAVVDTMVIGRSPHAAIRLVDSRVSREHARIDADDDAVRIVDLGSTNGVTVNGERVDTASLADGDRVGLGGVIVRYHTATPGPPVPR